MASTHKSLIAYLTVLGSGIGLCSQLHAQTIVPSLDGVGTSVLQNGNVFDIEGGVTSRNGTNLFHSFQKFGLDINQTANFRSNPKIQTIISRDVGGIPSLINGLLQVTGSNANFYFINPAGIILGSSARLNVPAAFMATTANGIGFGNNWFNAIGSNDYLSLGSAPSSFAFTMPQPGVIINAGNLTVGSGQPLTLLGGTVINTGQLSAPGGQITIAAVPGESLVRVSQPGRLLSLELQSLTAPSPLSALPFSPLSLPQLLTGGGGGHATGMVIDNNTVKLVGSGVTLPTASGTAIVSDQINVSGVKGGTVQVLGDRVALVNATIAASGTQGGGTVLIGGDYQGRGTVPKATLTSVDANSTISANAWQQGDGGKIVVWADGTTRFNGQIEARGGAQAGNGGLVEVSGKEHLDFKGQVDTSAANGITGHLLLDPRDITIVGGSGGTPPDDQELLSTGQLAGTNDYAISQTALETLAARTTFTLQADNNITIQALSNNTLNLSQTTGTFEFIAKNTFSMNPSNTLTTQGAGIKIQAGNQATIGGIEAGGSIDLVSDRLNFLGGVDSIRPKRGVSTQISLRSGSPNRLVRLEDNNSSTDKNNEVLDIHVGELAAIQQQNFTQLAIQGDDIDITRDFPSGTPIFPFRTKLVLEARNAVTIDNSIIPGLTVPSLVIRANKIVLPNAPGVIQSGSVTLGASVNSPQTNIVVGTPSAESLKDLTITQQSLDAITTPALQSLTFETGGNITVTQPVTTNAALNFQLQGNFTLLQPASTNGGNFSVNTTGTIQLASPVRTQGGTIALKGAALTTTLLDASNLSGQGGAINLQAGSVVTGDLNSSGQQGGAITVQAPTGITTQAINSSGSLLGGGAVNLSTLRAVDVGSINAQGGTQGSGGDIGIDFVDARGGDAGKGGTVDVTTNGRFRSQGSFLVNGIDTSIATGGGLGGGNIKIQVAKNQLNVPFTVGDSSINGTKGALSTGADNVILPRQVISGDFTQTGRSGTIQITSGSRVPTIEPIPTLPTTPSTIPSGDLSTLLIPNLIPPLPLALPDETVQRLSDIQRTLQQLEIDKGIRPALIYVSFLPMPLQDEPRQANRQKQRNAIETQFFSQKAPLAIPEYRLEGEQKAPHLIGYRQSEEYQPVNEPNRLELLMVTSQNVYSQPFCLDKQGAEQNCSGYLGDSHEAVTEKVQELQECFIKPQETKAASWNCARSAARLLYRRLLAPLESKIEGDRIDNIAFVMPVGLRQIPIAALLYDDQQRKEQSILTKKYSIGFVPSMTDTLIWPKRGMQESNLLALGVSKFHKRATDLPGVEKELKQVNEAWTKDRLLSPADRQGFSGSTSGGQFVNGARAATVPKVHQLHDEEVTALRWQQSRQSGQYPLVHLATHAQFEQTQPENSQLWFGDRALTFKEFEMASLHIPRIDLLILSACSTATSSDTSAAFEYGFAGLAHELGVKSVLASLWLANDQQTGDNLMPLFYKNLRDPATRTKAEALRKAQLSLYEDPNLDPRYWAGFVMVGSPW